MSGFAYKLAIPNLDKEARGYRTAERFIVKKDSYVSFEKKTNFRPESYWRLRQELENHGVVKNGDLSVITNLDRHPRPRLLFVDVVATAKMNGEYVWTEKK